MGMVKHSQSSQNSKFAMSLQYLKKEVRDYVEFFYMQKNLKDFIKLILSFSVCVPKHAQITQNKFAISLQYLKKEVSDELDFLHAKRHQSSCKLISTL